MEAMKEKVTVCRSWNCTFSSLCVWHFWSFVLITIPFCVYVYLSLSFGVCARVRSLQSNRNENCANFAFSCHNVDISYNSCVVLPLCPMYVLHRFNVEFTKLVTLRVHWIYCVERRFFAVDAVVCSSNSVALSVSSLANFGRSHSVFQTTNFITALIFISVFCSIHCTCILSFSFWHFIYVFMTNEWDVRRRDSKKDARKKRERIRDWARMISKCIITVVWVRTYSAICARMLPCMGNK